MRLVPDRTVKDRRVSIKMDYLSLCLICKDENDYLEEWLNYHILTGVERFYIYDNDSQISLRETLKDYVARGWVVITDIPGQAMQMYAYDHCLRAFGPSTRWLGFIDTDEFLVPKTSVDLKDLLQHYEEFGGLAVSSLFFGSNQHQERPAQGQLASYTLRTHSTFQDNELIKCIVQPARVLLPYSPHEFIYQETWWCVNENRMRVDHQMFPNHTEKIQLNHYYCRSIAEINMKLGRGRGDTSNAWPRQRFELVNRRATYRDETAIELVEQICARSLDAGGQVQAAEPRPSLLQRMAAAAQFRAPNPPQAEDAIDEPIVRDEIAKLNAIAGQQEAAQKRSDFESLKGFLLEKQRLYPNKISLYRDLTSVYLSIGDPASAWAALAHAWQIAPASYFTLSGMVQFFLRTMNYEMSEKTSRLLLDVAPHDLQALGFLTESLIGLNRYEEALKVGIPVVELASITGELPPGMGVYLIRKMANHLLEHGEAARAAQLWEAGSKCQPGDVDVLLEWCRALIQQGDKPRARQILLQAQSLSPRHAGIPQVQGLLDPAPARQAKKHRH